MLSHRHIREPLEPLETQVFRDGHRPAGAARCPIETQGVEQVDPHPERRPDGARKARKAEAPLRDVLQEARRQVARQPGPDLPLDRLLVVADEVGELERLLEFLEERLDGPAGAAGLGDGARAPREVVGDESHLHVLPVHPDNGGDAAQRLPILLRRALAGHAHGLVGEDARVFVPPSPGHLEDHVPLLAQDEEDAAPREAGQEGEVDVGPVGRQHGADVQAHAGLGRGLPPAVPRPVDAVERELERGRVDGEDVALQAEDEAAVLRVLREGRAYRPEVPGNGPIELFGDGGVAGAVGVREGVALRRGGAPDAVQFRLVQPRRVADLVQARRPRDLPAEQGRHVAGAGERPDVRLRLPRDPVRQPLGNPLDDLPQGGVRCSRWPRGCAVTRLWLLFFHAPAGYRRTAPGSALFSAGFQSTVLIKLFCSAKKRG